MSEDHFSALQSKVHHTDARVSAIEREVGNLGDQLTRIEHFLMDKPTPNYAAWAGVLLTMVLMIGGALTAGAEYVDLQLQPVRAELLQQRENQKEFREFQAQTHYELGVLHEWKRQELKGEKDG
jgi:hypothetical protein